jgi:hypothetical protein
MILVIDANVIFAALIKDSDTRKIILSGEFRFLAPEFVKNEVQKYSST